MRARAAAVSLSTIVGVIFAPALAHAEPPKDAQSASPAGAAAPTEAVPAESSGAVLDFDAPKAKTPATPQSQGRYLQFGVALTGEFVASAGALCNKTANPCILGSGGGVAARVGFRSESPWYFGLAYELSKQDPNKLYRLAILQQARFEARYYLPTGQRVEPYLAGGGGIAGYGNEWAVDTFGPAAHVGAGFEFQVSRTTVVGFALTYRAILFRGYTDSSRAVRDTGLAQLVGLDITLEARDPR